MEKQKIVIVTGAKGAGKGTSVDLMEKHYKVDNVYFAISCTTRNIRLGEKNGKHYHFLSEEEFLQKKEKNLFLETNYHHGAWYGTLKSEFEKEGLIVVDVDVVGALALKKIFPEALAFFIDTPSVGDLEKRLIGRNNDTPDQIQSGIDRYIQIESKHKNDFDHLIINENRYQMFADISCIIYQRFYGNILAMDGTSACGKGSISKRVGYTAGINAYVVPSGSLYRYMVYKLPDDYSNKDIKKVVSNFSCIELDELSSELYTEVISKKTSNISQDPEIRDMVKLLIITLAYGNHGKKFIVAEGRDMSTRVFRYANIKLFIDADLEIRARRRCMELYGNDNDWGIIYNNLINRDKADMERSIDPLYHDIDNGVVGISNDGLLEDTVKLILERHVYPKMKECTMYS
jgi:guanylate kinase